MKGLRLEWQAEAKQGSLRAEKELRYLGQPVHSVTTRHQVHTPDQLMTLLTMPFFDSMKCQLIGQCPFIKRFLYNGMALSKATFRQ